MSKLTKREACLIAKECCFSPRQSLGDNRDEWQFTFLTEAGEWQWSTYAPYHETHGDRRAFLINRARKLLNKRAFPLEIIRQMSPGKWQAYV